jgi:hypothetical protein
MRRGPAVYGWLTHLDALLAEAEGRRVLPHLHAAAVALYCVVDGSWVEGGGGLSAMGACGLTKPINQPIDPRPLPVEGQTQHCGRTGVNSENRGIPAPCRCRCCCCCCCCWSCCRKDGAAAAGGLVVAEEEGAGRMMALLPAVGGGGGWKNASAAGTQHSSARGTRRRGRGRRARGADGGIPVLVWECVGWIPTDENAGPEIEIGRACLLGSN